MGGETRKIEGKRWISRKKRGISRALAPLSAAKRGIFSWSKGGRGPRLREGSWTRTATASSAWRSSGGSSRVCPSRSRTRTCTECLRCGVWKRKTGDVHRFSSFFIDVHRFSSIFIHFQCVLEAKCSFSPLFGPMLGATGRGDAAAGGCAAPLDAAAASNSSSGATGSSCATDRRGPVERLRAGHHRTLQAGGTGKEIGNKPWRARIIS